MKEKFTKEQMNIFVKYDFHVFLDDIPFAFKVINTVKINAYPNEIKLDTYGVVTSWVTNEIKFLHYQVLNEEKAKLFVQDINEAIKIMEEYNKLLED